MDERLRFVARLLEGEKMAVLCREFDISRKTGYKIFSRYKDCGLEGLTDRSRRPVRQGCRLPFQIESLILQLKREHPSRLGLDQRLTRGIGWESTAFKSCRNKSISDGVSIRGVFEVASFRPGKALAAELFSPSVFELSSMLITESADSFFLSRRTRRAMTTHVR